jgi:MYXO-CTERM domain-containing protein
MSAAVRCATHPERAALGYCAQCGKPLCRACLVRLSGGNYCTPCASGEQSPVRRARRMPWWALALAAVALLILLRLVFR